METIAKKTPTSVTVIGWIFIFVAVSKILFNGVVLMTSLTMKQRGISPIPEEILSRMHLRALLQTVFAIFVLIASVQFLRLRAWARAALEVVSWLCLVYMICSGIPKIFSWISVISGASVVEGVSDPLLKAVGFTVPMVVQAVCLIVIIKFLRGKTIKEAVTQI